MNVHRHPAFLRAYRYLPHTLLNGAMRAIGHARRPRFAIDYTIRRWIERESIDMTEFDDGPFDTLESFFLRALRPGARPIGEGLIAPADGIIVGAGECDGGTILQVKGKPITVERLAPGTRADRYVTIFLTPRGYHYVHAPCDGVLRDVRWIAGRFFPQNEDALQHIDAIYARNERAVLRFADLTMVMVGASLIGGIHLHDLDRSRWVREGVTPIETTKKKGDPIGHFTFGSTVVLLLPSSYRGPLPAVGGEIRMGQTIL